MQRVVADTLAHNGRPAENQNSAEEASGDRAQHILVPVSMSQCERPAVRLGLQLAAAWDAKLTILHVLPQLESETTQRAETNSVHWLDAIDNLHEALNPMRHSRPGDRLRILDDARRRLAAFLAEVAPASLVNAAAIRLECAFGNAAEEIVRFVSAESIDLLVLTSHLSHWRLPIVPADVHRVLRGVRQQVIVVRPDSAERSTPAEASASIHPPASIGALGS